MPNLAGFLDGIIDCIDNLGVISRKRAESFAKPLILQGEDFEFSSKLETEDG